MHLIIIGIVMVPPGTLLMYVLLLLLLLSAQMSKQCEADYSGIENCERSPLEEVVVTCPDISNLLLGRWEQVLSVPEQQQLSLLNKFFYDFLRIEFQRVCLESKLLPRYSWLGIFFMFQPTFDRYEQSLEAEVKRLKYYVNLATPENLCRMENWSMNDLLATPSPQEANFIRSLRYRKNIPFLRLHFKRLLSMAIKNYKTFYVASFFRFQLMLTVALLISFYSLWRAIQAVNFKGLSLSISVNSFFFMVFIPVALAMLDDSNYVSLLLPFLPFVLILSLGCPAPIIINSALSMTLFFFSKSLSYTLALFVAAEFIRRFESTSNFYSGCLFFVTYCMLAKRIAASFLRYLKD